MIVWAAASLTRPVRAALDSFRAQTGVPYTLETQASLELARRMTELGQTPDVVLMADRTVITSLLVPKHVGRYALFARNRMVLAYTPRSKGASEIAHAARWWALLDKPGVQVGRADPSTDPSGYRTLLTFQLLERHYAEAGLAARLLAAAPPKNVRPREADQIALIEAGELDYVWTYENLARAAKPRVPGVAGRCGPGHRRRLARLFRGQRSRAGACEGRFHHGARRADRLRARRPAAGAALRARRALRGRTSRRQQGRAVLRANSLDALDSLADAREDERKRERGDHRWPPRFASSQGGTRTHDHTD